MEIETHLASKMNCSINRFTSLALVALLETGSCAEIPNPNEPDDYAISESGSLNGKQHRVIVSTDIGGTDPDDFQYSTGIHW